MLPPVTRPGRTASAPAAQAAAATTTGVLRKLIGAASFVAVSIDTADLLSVFCVM